MADKQFDEHQWSENFRVTGDTFLKKMEREITARNTPMRQAISARRRLDCTTYLLQQNAALLEIFLVHL